MVSVVWSPRRIDEALASHEELGRVLGIDVAFITGYNEHDGCARANQLVKETDAELYVLSYDDQVVQPEQLERLLELRSLVDPGDVVSGWQVLGGNVPWGAAVHPEWGTEKMLALDEECFYLSEDLRAMANHGNQAQLIESYYFAALTVVPRATLLESPIWALPAWVPGVPPYPNPDGSGRAYDKGCCSDWTLAIDIVKAGHKIWIAPEVEVTHLSPFHNIPMHEFTGDRDEKGVSWGTRPR